MDKIGGIEERKREGCRGILKEEKEGEGFMGTLCTFILFLLRSLTYPAKRFLGQLLRQVR
jgi:hypothetical protein